jgi:N-dimethylarginine dimethylaminohydrolase
LLSSSNEWDPLKEVILGTATNAHWPVKCPSFRNLEKTTSWKETPVPSGPVNQKIIDETNEDLDIFEKTLKSLGVVVHRPNNLNFASFDGMYNYCPRDRVLVVGNVVIDAPMLYPTRTKEIDAIRDFIPGTVINCLEPDATFDAANICRLGQDLLYLVSESGNVSGAKWLQAVLPGYRVHILDNIYKGVHIDSTIVPVREGLVVLNSDRIHRDNIPAPLKDWDKIWISGDQIVAQDFVEYPYASKYIALNFLTINPNLVICDPHQRELRKALSQHGVDTIGVELRHSRTLGGGHHCVTLDLWRSQS